MLHTISSKNFRASNIVKNVNYAQNVKLMKDRVLVSFPVEYYHKQEQRMVAGKITYSVDQKLFPKEVLVKLSKNK